MNKNLFLTFLVTLLFQLNLVASEGKGLNINLVIENSESYDVIGRNNYWTLVFLVDDEGRKTLLTDKKLDEKAGETVVLLDTQVSLPSEVKSSSAKILIELKDRDITVGIGYDIFTGLLFDQTNFREDEEIASLEIPLADIEAGEVLTKAYSFEDSEQVLNLEIN